MRTLCAALLVIMTGCSPRNTAGDKAVHAPSAPVTRKLTGDPFDPERSLYPEHPITALLSVQHEPVKEHFDFGELPQFRITFSNQLETAVDLAGMPLNGNRFRPHIFLHILREDGRDLGYGTDLSMATNVSRIPPGETASIDFPSSKAVAARTEFYRLDPDVLLPGKYQCYFQFWVEKQGVPERLLSPLTPMVIVDDGSGDAQISKAVQTARGVEEHLELLIREDKDTLISLTARNNGPDPIYLGHNWTWRSRHAGDQDWNEDGGGPRSSGYLTVPSYGTQSLGCVSFRDHRPPGKYMIQARYFDHEGQLRKASNTIKISVR